MNEVSSRLGNGKLRIRFGLAVMILGWLVFILGVYPSLFRLDRSPVVGFVQISVFLFGLALLCVGGNITLSALWGERRKSIAADIGYRMVATGYLIAAISGLADVFGFGSQPSPAVPYFGQYQATGVIIGLIMIIIGFLMLIPYPAEKKKPIDKNSPSE
jgi:hypothetical protein